MEFVSVNLQGLSFLQMYDSIISENKLSFLLKINDFCVGGFI